MLDDQVQKTQDQVRSARAVAHQALSNPALSAAEKAQLQEAYDALDVLEGQLELAIVASWVTDVSTRAKDLAAIAGRMKAAQASLRQVADTIAQVAQGVGALASIADLALSNGLL